MLPSEVIWDPKFWSWYWLLHLLRERRRLPPSWPGGRRQMTRLGIRQVSQVLYCRLASLQEARLHKWQVRRRTMFNEGRRVMFNCVVGIYIVGMWAMFDCWRIWMFTGPRRVLVNCKRRTMFSEGRRVIFSGVVGMIRTVGRWAMFIFRRLAMIPCAVSNV